MKLAYFGSSNFSVYVLDELEKLGILPGLVITTPDKPKGRKLVLTPTPVKTWAQEHNIEVLDPKSLKNNSELNSHLSSVNCDLFLVASYGKIIPKDIFDMPEHKTLNIHPSLLPKYRGASPVVSQILNDEKEVGVTIMQIDEEMDHGNIVKLKEVKIEKLLGRIELEERLAREGARLFAEILPDWLEGKLEAKPQEESEATYCSKIKKEDGLLDLDDDQRKNYLKFLAYQGWPGTYFFENNKRIIVTDLKIENCPDSSSGSSILINQNREKLKILSVKPEGKNEMPYVDYLRGLQN
jgi:methionyl-tRNA formyltransferase